ncbi:MAG: sulfate ABC transporter ATP-binding protein [Lachnospiraceae bacterium]|jgi:sulfate transport system ATP-binding protein|nr:sulfate ABC transporter ATP-binding protein [Lachnospiraceae bacterium]
MDYIQLQDIHKAYGIFPALKGVSLSIGKGKLVGLLGPSGSGKTTILRSIAGLEQPERGDIFIDGVRVNDLPASKRGIGFVFQNYALFRYMTVFDNIAFGLRVQKTPKGEIRDRVEELLSLIGMEGYGDRFPNQLSGGQKQRVAFARAMAPNPRVLLLDEPFAAIDAKVRKELRSWLRETIRKVGITSIFVTHDQDEAIEVADEIIITNGGKVEQVGSPAEIYRNPETPFVAKFIGQSQVIREYERLEGFDRVEGFDEAVVRPEFVEVLPWDGGGVGTGTNTGVQPGNQRKAVAPSDGDADRQGGGNADDGRPDGGGPDDGNGGYGKITQAFFRGNTTELHISLGGTQLVASQSVTDAEVFSVGDTVRVRVSKLILCGDGRVEQVATGI